MAEFGKNTHRLWGLATGSWFLMHQGSFQLKACRPGLVRGLEQIQISMVLAWALPAGPRKDCLTFPCSSSPAFVLKGGWQGKAGVAWEAPRLFKLLSMHFTSLSGASCSFLRSGACLLIPSPPPSSPPPPLPVPVQGAFEKIHFLLN